MTVAIRATAIAALALLAPMVDAQVASAVSPAIRVDGARGALRFWTAARMESAHQLSAWPIRARNAPVRDPARAAPGAPRLSPPRRPGTAIASSATEAISDPTTPLTSQNGAIFVVGAFGATARCSGTSVNAPNLSVVFTAGHCVHLGRHWLGRRWVFVPGYHNGERPFGVFAAKWLGTTRQWLADGNENFDVGAAVVARNEHGQRLGAAVGGYGIAWNLSPNQVFDVYGYPVAPPFNGSTLERCPQTPYLGHDFLSFFFPGPLNLAVECEVTGGASGGGWLISGGLLNGVTAYGYPGNPEGDYSPYFGSEVGRLFARARAVK